MRITVNFLVFQHVVNLKKIYRKAGMPTEARADDSKVACEFSNDIKNILLMHPEDGIRAFRPVPQVI
jgi:hypothetical protein